MGNGLFSRQASSCCPPDPAETPWGVPAKTSLGKEGRKRKGRKSWKWLPRALLLLSSLITRWQCKAPCSKPRPPGTTGQSGQGPPCFSHCCSTHRVWVPVLGQTALQLQLKWLGSLKTLLIEEYLTESKKACQDLMSSVVFTRSKGQIHSTYRGLIALFQQSPGLGDPPCPSLT